MFLILINQKYFQKRPNSCLFLSFLVFFGLFLSFLVFFEKHKMKMYENVMIYVSFEL